MKFVAAGSWNQLKSQTATHLTDPHWLGGVHCIDRAALRARGELPAGPWEALLVRDARPSQAS